ncbi:ribonuclease Y [Deinococcus lacus]|uniref:Ribonuclease Y n=1 Tax=Deinococcus lacus TaxID=392561 RepID=A0ABW1YC20_9DEIO
MTPIYVVLALLGLGLLAAAYWLGQRQGAEQRAAQDLRLEAEARDAAAAIVVQARAEAEQRLSQAAASVLQERQSWAQERQQGAESLAEQREQARQEAARLMQEAARAAQESQEQIRSNVAALELQRSSLSALQRQTEQERAGLEQERAQLKADMQQERQSLAEDRRETRQEREELKREIERLNRRAEQLDARGDKLSALEERLEAQQSSLQGQAAQLEQERQLAEERVFEIAGLSESAARELILSRLDAELEEEKAQRVRAMQARASKEAGRTARHLIAQAIQRSAAETSAQLSVSVVPIPSDAMKGRLIGREGRNIRAFEALTGVDLIIDDTPEAVMLSSFNPIRREVARHVLGALVEDGRIHPARIEEMVGKAQEDMKQFIHAQGEEALLEAGVPALRPGLTQLLGRMYFRSSYGQNVLKHSVQVAHLTGIMAGELGLDAELARRAGLLHDIGKSIDREIEGTHVDIGIGLARRFGEPPEVVDAIAHHHDPENGETLYSVLVAAADAISAARPGARREELEAYTRRLEALEQIAVSFPGVQQAYAIQAGREVRVIVEPGQVSDAQATLLAREIAGRVEQDMEYPGQVQVTVVRESRAVEVAR